VGAFVFGDFVGCIFGGVVGDTVITVGSIVAHSSW
jgi:hypothetical protein